MWEISNSSDHQFHITDHLQICRSSYSCAPPNAGIMSAMMMVALVEKNALLKKQKRVLLAPYCYLIFELLLLKKQTSKL